MPGTGGEAVPITQNGGFVPFPSPDGKWIYYSTLAMAFLDRLVEGRNYPEVKGKSYRAGKASLAEKSPA